MFYKTEIKDHIRVPPNLFNLSTEEAVLVELKKKYEGFISKDIGVVVDIGNISEVRDGVIIPGDGAAYYDITFDLMTFKPEVQEIIYGRIKDIVEFGAFISIGPMEGMIHVSQTMDDFVSFAKDKVLTGKETKRTLKVGDRCKARLIAVSFKDASNPKLGLTMRQEFLGRIEWIEEDKNPEKKKSKK